MISFTRFELRTTDVPGARAFYAALGLEFDGVSFAIARLSERALAAGAPPNWPGHLGVDDVEPVRIPLPGGFGALTYENAAALARPVKQSASGAELEPTALVVTR